jgi:cation diffusion facilitator family transporter
MHHHTSHVKKTYLVFLLTLVVSCFEIYFGIDTHSHALKTDGWHLVTHVVIFGLAILAYSIRPNHKYYISILDYTGLILGIFLLIIGFSSLVDSLFSFDEAHTIVFERAIMVVSCSILFNILNFFILKPELHCGDNNLKAIYLHVIYDLLTSIGTLFALLIGKYFHVHGLDTFVAVVISLVILKFAFTFTINVYKKLRN